MSERIRHTPKEIIKGIFLGATQELQELAVGIISYILHALETRNPKREREQTEKLDQAISQIGKKPIGEIEEKLGIKYK